MAGPTTAALDLSAGAVADAVTEISLHTADPGTTGAGEVIGGGYARAAVGTDFTYGAASGGTADLTGTKPVFAVPAPDEVTHYGRWQGATFLGGEELVEPQPFPTGGTYTLNSAPING